jgi:hypothetical protein
MGAWILLWRIVTGQWASRRSDDEPEVKTPRIPKTERYIDGNVVKTPGDYGDDM